MNYKALDEDIIMGEDGFYIYWPTDNRGAHNSHSLRLIAQILDELNAEWEKEMNEHFKGITYALAF